MKELSPSNGLLATHELTCLFVSSGLVPTSLLTLALTIVWLVRLAYSLDKRKANRMLISDQ